MAVRTFFWEKTAPKPKKSAWLRPSTGLLVGNVGDIYNRDVVRYLFDDEPENVESGGNRILLVGSTVHRLQPGDMVAGVGTKGSPIPPAPTERVRIVGVRGPLTADALRSAGYSLDELKFMFDPGLLIDRIFPELLDIEPDRGRVVFIPHYRERTKFRSNRKYSVVDVDSTPRDFGAEIRRAETVYSSSLHGVIFAHALGRPAVLVSPLTEEPEIKYRDYFASVKLPWNVPLPLEDALRSSSPALPPDLGAVTAGLEIPSSDELRAAGIIVPRALA
jgi:hypothetical protein